MRKPTVKDKTQGVQNTRNNTPTRKEWGGEGRKLGAYTATVSPPWALTDKTPEALEGADSWDALASDVS